MSERLSPAAERVQLLLREAGSACEVVQLPATARSAADAAAAIGCRVAQITGVDVPMEIPSRFGLAIRTPPTRRKR